MNTIVTILSGLHVIAFVILIVVYDRDTYAPSFYTYYSKGNLTVSYDVAQTPVFVLLLICVIANVLYSIKWLLPFMDMTIVRAVFFSFMDVALAALVGITGLYTHYYLGLVAFFSQILFYVAMNRKGWASTRLYDELTFHIYVAPLRISYVLAGLCFIPIFAGCATSEPSAVAVAAVIFIFLGQLLWMYFIAANYDDTLYACIFVIMSIQLALWS